jgi:hypothetical protein
MKRIFLLLSISFLMQTVNAQIWCTPSSEWYFTHSPAFGTGYKHWTYLYDTTIAGKNCNKIKDNTVGQSYWPPANVNYTEYLYTYTNNKVVYIKDVFQTGTNNFDTLFNFNAAIGNKWRMAPTSNSFCASSFVTVLDTGRNTIQGQSLKWLKLNYYSAGNFTVNVNDTIYERFGALGVYPYWPYNVCPTMTDADQGGPLRCFSDNQINGYVHTWTTSCNYYYVGMKENEIENSSFTLYPNPANEFLMIRNTSKAPKQVSVVNILGEAILTENFSGESMNTLGILSLPKGIYFLKYAEEGKKSSVQKFVKE